MKDTITRRDSRAHIVALNLEFSYLMAAAETREREFTALANIPGNFPKTVLSLDNNDFSQLGVDHRNLIN